MIPIAGSANTYAYATMGEFVAWIIGWALVPKYALGAVTVAIAWSEYLNNLSGGRTSLPSERSSHLCWYAPACGSCAIRIPKFNRRARATRAPASDKEAPIDTPKNNGPADCRKSSCEIWPRVAPMAIRIPISLAAMGHYEGDHSGESDGYHEYGQNREDSGKFETLRLFAGHAAGSSVWASMPYSASRQVR